MLATDLFALTNFFEFMANFQARNRDHSYSRKKMGVRRSTQVVLLAQGSILVALDANSQV